MTGADGIQHGTPEGFAAGCRKERDCPASYTHGMCCLYAHVRAATDVRYFKAKARNPDPAAIAHALGMQPLARSIAMQEAAVDEQFDARDPGFRYKPRPSRSATTPTTPETPAMTEPAPAPKPVPAPPKKPLTATPVAVPPEKYSKHDDIPRELVPPYDPPMPISTDRWTDGLSGAGKTAKLREIREWCRANGFPGVPVKGRIPQDALAAYATADHRTETEREADKNAAEARAEIAEKYTAGQERNVYTDVLDEARGRATDDTTDVVEAVLNLAHEAVTAAVDAQDEAHFATPQELAEIFGVPEIEVVDHLARYDLLNIERMTAQAATAIAEQMYDETHTPPARPEWADVPESMEEVLAHRYDLEQALERTRTALAEAHAERDAAQRSMVLALRQWAEGRAELEFMNSLLEGQRRASDSLRRSQWALANLRRDIQSRSKRRFL